jgi:hypothetical protein
VAGHWRWQPPSRRSHPPRRPGINWSRRASALTVRAWRRHITFHDGESLDDFTLHLAKMVHEKEILGDLEEPRKVAAKYLRVILKKYTLVTISIEFVLEISTLSVDEITNRLRVVEGCGDEEDEAPAVGGKLLLIEELLQARMKEKQHGESNSKPCSSKEEEEHRRQGRP